MNFELIDNLFQATVMSGAAIVATVLAFRNKIRHFLILALAYASFAMGTLYYVLHLAIIGNVPQLFYVAEVSWMASYLFFLSLLILRTESIKLRLSPLAGICAFLTVAAFLCARILPSVFVSLLFSLTMGAILYLAVFHLQSGRAKKSADIVMLCCVLLQLLLYRVSGYMNDFTQFNLYFAVDIVLTLTILSILPLTVREVMQK